MVAVVLFVQLNLKAWRLIAENQAVEGINIASLIGLAGS